MRLGIDIGGTKVHAIAIDDERRVLGQVRLPTPRGERDVLDTVRGSILQLAERLGGSAGTVESLGIGVPGSVDADRGVVSHAVNLGIEQLELADGVRDLVDGAVRVDNDVNAAALGAFDQLADSPASMAYLNVGTGLAAGLVLGGRVWRGYGGIAGEVGHVPVDAHGARCPCGQVGCLETVASGVAITADWTPNPSLSLADAVALGDERAIMVRDRVIRGVADATEMLFLTVGVQLVVLGGGVVTGTPAFVELVRQELATRSSTSQFLASLGLDDRLREAPPGAEIPAMGAALLGMGPAW